MDKSKTRAYKLTDNQAKVLRDILRTIGKDTDFNRQFARGVGLRLGSFNMLTDAAYRSLHRGFEFSE